MQVDKLWEVLHPAAKKGLKRISDDMADFHHDTRRKMRHCRTPAETKQVEREFSKKLRTTTSEMNRVLGPAVKLLMAEHEELLDELLAGGVKHGEASPRRSLADQGIVSSPEHSHADEMKVSLDVVLGRRTVSSSTPVHVALALPVDPHIAQACSEPAVNSVSTKALEGRRRRKKGQKKRHRQHLKWENEAMKRLLGLAETVPSVQPFHPAKEKCGASVDYQTISTALANLQGDVNQIKRK